MTDIALLRDRARSVPPVVPPTIVSRSRLDHHFAGGAARIVRVLAPAGYGKSTLVARWVSNDARPVRWLDLERIDNDPVVLVCSLLRGLSDLAPVDDDLLPEPGLDERRFVERTVPAVAAHVARCDRPFVLVLDDVHCIDGDASLALIDAVAGNIGAGSTLVLAGRSHRDRGTLARLRLSPGVVDLTASDLALDIHETEDLLHTAGLDPEIDHLTDIQAQFEGWPAGLRLASLVLSTHGPKVPLDAVVELGDLRYVSEYLQAEWIAHLPHERREFLMEVACLGRFTAAMCDGVLQRASSSRELLALEQDGAVVLPLDARGEWYRMHPLLVRWLTTEFRRTDPEGAVRVHRSAAAWWERHGDIDLAIDHALQAGDVELTERLVIDHAPVHFARGLHLSVQRWLTTFTADHIRSSPNLCSLAAVAALQLGDGRRALRWSRLLESSLPTQHLGLPNPVAAGAAVLRATLEQRPAAELAAGVEDVRRELHGGSWLAFAWWVLGGLRFMYGDERARDILDEGAFEAELAGAQVLQANCLATSALVSDLAGDRDSSLKMATTAYEVLGETRSRQLPTTAMITAMHALVAARDGRHDAARGAITLARRHIDGYGDVGPWFNVMVRLAAAHACLLVDDVVQAEILTNEIDAHMAFEPASAGACDHVRALRERVSGARASFVDRSWTLTSAELRVLQFLATPLTLTEIATRLFVSRNTVKSHAAAIYRKLGTTSRRRTVELARSAGLLAQPNADL